MKYVVVSWIDGWHSSSHLTNLIEAKSAADARKIIKQKRSGEYGADNKASNVIIEQVSRYKF
jgi:hypothetical protein